MSVYHLNPHNHRQHFPAAQRAGKSIVARCQRRENLYSLKPRRAVSRRVRPSGRRQFRHRTNPEASPIGTNVPVIFHPAGEHRIPEIRISTLCELNRDDRSGLAWSIKEARNAGSSVQFYETAHNRLYSITEGRQHSQAEHGFCFHPTGEPFPGGEWFPGFFMEN